MSKMTFKVGDRVRSLVTNDGAYSTWHAGREGTVRVLEGNIVGVEFEGPPSPSAHRLGDTIESKSGWWFYYHNTVGERTMDLKKLPKVKAKAAKPKQTYLGNGKHEWESVTGCTMRLRVPGGYLYKTHGGADAATFVALPEVTKHVI